MNNYVEQRNILAVRLKEQMPRLEALLASVRDEWIYEDRIYRFYHGSYKVYEFQGATEEIVSALQALYPERKLTSMFMAIVHDGTGKTFSREDNERWAEATRPIVEAFLHALYFLKMAVKYGKELGSVEGPYPSGMAALFTLYDMW